MRKLNRKGFTLIELLAVVIVLGIVTVVTIPSVIDAVKTARQKAYDDAIVIIEKYVNTEYVSCNIDSASDPTAIRSKIFDANCALREMDYVVETNVTVSDYILRETNFSNDIESVEFVYDEENEKYTVFTAPAIADGKFDGVQDKEIEIMTVPNTEVGGGAGLNPVNPNNKLKM